jgi:hypothetical protein
MADSPLTNWRRYARPSRQKALDLSRHGYLEGVGQRAEALAGLSDPATVGVPPLDPVGRFVHLALHDCRLQRHPPTHRITISIPHGKVCKRYWLDGERARWRLKGLYFLRYRIPITPAEYAEAMDTILGVAMSIRHFRTTFPSGEREDRLTASSPAAVLHPPAPSPPAGACNTLPVIHLQECVPWRPPCCPSVSIPSLARSSTPSAPA